VARSRIPLFGLPHRLDVVRRADVDDGAGGVIPDSSEETDIYIKRRARVASMTDEDEQKLFGNASGERWRVVMIYSPNVARSDFIRLNSSSRAAPIPTTTLYRILYVKSQIDDKGRFHHTSIVMELEDA